MADRHDSSAGQREQGTLFPGLAEFAREWTSAAVATSTVPMSRAELRGILTGFAESLAVLVRERSADLQPAVDVGTGLVSAQLVGSQALEASLRVVGRRLLPALGLTEDEAHSTRLVDLLGAMTSGYLDALRDHISEQQETMKKAVFRARDAAERALRASERRFRTVFSESVVGIAIGDLQGNIVSSNLALQDMLGLTSDELRQRTAYDLMPATDAEDMAKAYERLISGTYTSLRSEQRLIRGDGEPIWAHIVVSLIKDEHGLPDYPVVMVEDLTDLHMLQERWRQQTLHDPLTGLFTRAFFLSKMESAIGGSAPDVRIGLAVFGLDGLSVINNGVSHEAGDAVLKAAADRLRSVLDPDNGLLGRISGDHFALLVVRSTTNSMIDLVERARRRIAEPVKAMDRQLSVTASVGIVERCSRGAEPMELLRAADMALGWAKREGKDQWALFETDRGEAERHSMALATELPGALHEQRVSVEYQPIARLEDRRLVGVEALVFWDHHELGVLSPADFLPMATRTGHILPLAGLVLREACTQAANWRTEFGDAAPLMAVHLPDRQARDQELIGLLMSMVRSSGVEPDQLQLEIDQNVIRDDRGEPLEALSVLADNGFQVVISGVGGSGRGPLTLAGLPVRGVKLAPTFVAALGTAARPDPLVVRAIGGVVSLAEVAGLPVLAAGVTSQAQAATLRDVGVVLGQGEHFGPFALPFEIEPMIAEGTVDPAP
ncbi:MAG: EAL domain-containing protein [Kutzneria sp.]|nr:EAL domain-containing protein [Kutzneria sp.]MBV9845405.1 EAL domain-containing protein [Kutzneria sp.]